MQQPMLTGFLKIIIVVALVYLAIVLLYAAFQRSLIYYPHKIDEPAAIAQAETRNIHPWRTGTGELIGWIAGEDTADKRFLVFHGNAGNAAMRDYIAHLFSQMEPGWQIYLFEYPGYGSRDGRPSETSIVASAIDAFDSLLGSESSQPIYLFGESLGSGVAAQVAAARPEEVSGLLLVTPFSRLADVGRYHFPWLPIRPLLRDQFDSVQALDNYTGPVVVVTSGQDQVVPPEFGKKLYDAYSGPKHYHQLTHSGHNNINYQPDSPIWQQLIDELLQKESR